MRALLPVLALIAAPCFAQDAPLPLICAGSNPGWTMQITRDGADFSYLYDADLNFTLETRAEGDEWPRAYTFVGRGTSAILLIEPATCVAGLMSARVFTQRGETPILLTGCCNLLNR